MLLSLLVLTPGAVRAQQLEPRAYSPAPIDANFAGVAAFYSSGGVVADAALPVENVSARVYTVAPFYGRTFDLVGRLASVTALVPIARATVRGDVQEASRSIDRFGLLDPQLRLAWNWIGGAALTPREFRAYRPQTTLGSSFTVALPLGQYDPSKLINLGTHRWSFKIELGLSQPAGPWLFELYTGATFFQNNDDFYGGQVRKQDPLASYQAHIVYNFRPHLWAAGNFTYYAGGATRVGEQPRRDRLGNSRAGVTLSLPLSRSNSIKLSWARGVSTRIGSNFTTFGLAWTSTWF